MESSFLLLNTDIRDGFLSMTLVLGGESTVETTANTDRQEIGRYRCRLRDETYRQCAELLQKSGFEKIDTSGELEPGVAMIAFGKGGGNEIVLKSVPLSKVPESVQPFVRAMKDASEKIRENKLRVLSGDASSVKAVFKTDEPIAFRLRFSNTGIETLKFKNPLKGKGAQSSISLLIQSVAMKEPSNPTVLDVARSNLAFSSDSSKDLDPPSEGLVSLLADQTLELRLTKKMYLKPGTYRAAITAHFTNQNPEDPTEIVGGLTMDVQNFSIEPN